MTVSGSAKPDFFRSFFFLTFFILVRFFAYRYLDVVSEYATYVFEAIFMVLVAWFVRFSFFKPTIITRLGIVTLISLGLAGFGAHRLAVSLPVVIPFDFQDREVLLFLLVLGPILEELLFRGALTQCLKGVFRFSMVWGLMSCALFAFSHLFAYFSVPPEYQPFVVYQGLYTFILAAVLLILRVRTDGLWVPIIGHALFNLGFYLSYYFSSSAQSAAVGG